MLGYGHDSFPIKGKEAGDIRNAVLWKVNTTKFADK